MSSRRTGTARLRRFSATVAGIAIPLLVLGGCSLYEGPPPPRTQDFGQGTLGCLKHFNSDLESYFDGKATPEGVNRTADCAISALRAFGDLVQGENRDRFTAREVRDFLQLYFLDDVVVSDSFLQEIMRVKQALVGGEATDFTPADLKGAEGLIDVFRKVFLRLLPYTPFSLDRIAQGDLPFVEGEASAIADVGDLLGKGVTERDSTYSFDELGRLLDEIVRAFPGSEGAVRGIRENLRLAAVLKEMLISPGRPRGTVTAAEWKVIFRDGGRWIGNYLKYRNLQGRYPDWTRGSGRKRLFEVAGQSIDLLSRAATRNGSTGIPLPLIQEAIGDLDWDGTIGGIHFQKTTLELILPPIVQHFLGGTDPTETGRAATRLTVNHLARLRGTLREWVDGSRYLEGVYARATRDPDFAENSMISTADVLNLDVRDVLREKDGVTDEAVKVADGIREDVAHTVALSDRDSEGAIFDGKNRTRGRVYRELVRYAWLRPLMKAAVLGYSTGGGTGGLTQPEFESMIRDYWQVLLDFKLVANGVNTPEKDSKNRFREASLFTQLSDGNSVISIGEGVQLVLYMLSADPLGNRVHERAQSLCPVGPIDPYGEPSIEPECYREKILDFSSANPDVRDLYSSFPLLVRFYDGLSPEDRSEFRRYAELAIRKPGFTPKTYFRSDDSDSLPMMFTYIEALFLRFDGKFDPKTGAVLEPADGFIDKPEARVAFPVFQRTLADLSDMDPNNGKVLSVFYYLLAKGNPPVDDSMGAWKRFWHSADFLWWHLTKPKFKADRLGLLQVFATLSNTSPNPTPPPTPKTAEEAAETEKP